MDSTVLHCMQKKNYALFALRLKLEYRSVHLNLIQFAAARVEYHIRALSSASRTKSALLVDTRYWPAYYSPSTRWFMWKSILIGFRSVACTAPLTFRVRCVIFFVFFHLTFLFHALLESEVRCKNRFFTQITFKCQESSESESEQSQTSRVDRYRV